MRLYASEEAHFSLRKAAAMLGIGSDNVRSVPTDSRLRMDPVALDRLVREDLAAGYLPFCVVATAGTAGTGAVDPIGDIADVARAHQSVAARGRRVRRIFRPGPLGARLLHAHRRGRFGGARSP